MVNFIYSHFAKPKRPKHAQGGYNIVEAHNYYLLTDSGRIAKRHVGTRKGADNISDREANQTVLNDPHPGFVSPFTVEDNNYILYARTGSLNNFQLTPQQARIALYQLIQTVKYLHENLGLGHFDIKPENIVIRDDGTFALIDFDGVQKLSKANDIICDPHFTPIEYTGYGKIKFPKAHDIWTIGLSILKSVKPKLYAKYMPKGWIRNNKESVKLAINKMITELSKRDSDLANLLATLLTFNPKDRIAQFENILQNPCFQGFPENAYDMKLIQAQPPPEAYRKDYYKLKMYVADLRKQIRSVKERRRFIDPRQRRLQLTVLRHHRNQALLNMAIIESENREFKIIQGFERNEFSNITHLFVPTVKEWESSLKRTDRTEEQVDQQQYPDIASSLQQYHQINNQNEKKEILNALNELLSEMALDDPALTRLKNRLDFVLGLHEDETNLIRFRDEHLEEGMDLIRKINNFCESDDYLDKRIALAQLIREYRRLHAEHEDSPMLTALKEVLDQLREDMKAIRIEARIPTPKRWEKLSERFYRGGIRHRRTKTTRAIDKLIEKFNSPHQNRLQIAQEIRNQCDEYLKTHDTVTSRTDVILQLKQCTEIFISLYSIPSVNDWHLSLQQAARGHKPNREQKALVGEITDLVDQFYHQDVDQEKVAIKMIKKCNQYLDESGGDAPFAKNVSNLLSQAIYHLHVAQALNPTPVDQDAFVGRLGLG